MYKNIDILLNELAEQINLSPSVFEKAEARYNAVGTWLNREESTLSKCGAKVIVYIQGSANLGTTIKPTTGEDEYDIDVVCEIKNLSKDIVTQDRKSVV